MSTIVDRKEFRAARLDRRGPFEFLVWRVPFGAFSVPRVNLPGPVRTSRCAGPIAGAVSLVAAAARWRIRS